MGPDVSFGVAYISTSVPFFIETVFILAEGVNVAALYLYVYILGVKLG
jgi:hypothetical protein